MKKGFTLIELLAVIVILAIIASIVVPIVLSIIDNSKESAAKNSAEFYLHAVNQAIMKQNMKSEEEFDPSLCMINSEGNAVCDDITLEIETSGKKPNSGTIIFGNSGSVDASLTFDNTSIITDKDGELINSKNIKICEPVTSETKTTGNVPKGKFAAGDEYICEVSDGVKYNFFVVSTEGNKVNLILDRNINDDGSLATVAVGEHNSHEGRYNLMPWITIEDYTKANTDNTPCEYDACIDEGPTTAIRFLNKAVASWTNIPNLNETYEDENINKNTLTKGTTGYGTIRLIGKARMAKFSEVYGENKCEVENDANLEEKSNTCPLWLTNYLDNEIFAEQGDFHAIHDMPGYWLLSSNDATLERAWTVHHYRQMDDSKVHYLDRRGIRPVISIYKSNIK